MLLINYAFTRVVSVRLLLLKRLIAQCHNKLIPLQPTVSVERILNKTSIKRQKREKNYYFYLKIFLIYKSHGYVS